MLDIILSGIFIISIFAFIILIFTYCFLLSLKKALYDIRNEILDKK